MLKLIPKGVFSWDFRVLEDDEEIAFIDRDWWRERASFTVEGKTYDVRRTSLMQGRFVLEHGGTVLAEATKSSAFKRAFDVAIGSEFYALRATSFFGREFSLSQGGTPVGYIRPTTFWGRTAEATFPARMNRPTQLFMAFLVLLLWKRAADSASA